MPYNPGVEDRSGQILAAGISQISGNYRQDRQRWEQKQEENKALTSQAKALETLLPVYAQTAGVAPEEIEKFLAPSADETPRGRVARLSQAVEGIVGNAALKSRQLQDQQMQTVMAGELQRQQAAARNQQEGDSLNAQIDRALAQQRAMAGGQLPRPPVPGGPMLAAPGAPAGPASLGNMSSVMGRPGNLGGAGVLTPQMQAQIDEIVGSPAGQMRAIGARVTPEMIADFAKLELTHAPKPGKPLPGSSGYKTIEIPGVGTMVVDQATGEPIDGGKLNKPHEKKSDEKALTATEISQLQALQQAGHDLGALESAFSEIGDKDWGGPVAGPLRRVATAGTDTNTSRIDNLVTASTPNLARGVFREVGVLTDEDIKRYQKLLPNVNDTAAQRTQKLNDLRKRMTEQTEETLSTLKAAGRDVSGLREKILGDRAAAATPGAAGQVKGPDGAMHRIVTVRGQQGIIAGGKFFPIIQ